MFKKVFGVVKRLIISVFLIYAYNKLAFPLNVNIPINVITILMVSVCGIPSLLVLVLFSLVCI